MQGISWRKPAILANLRAVAELAKVGTPPPLGDRY